ncbi:VOC family protein [Streptomyces sp. NPDC051920]|uniref:VOC family protein n=1 Tax=Streptomyces sp. NPDC051920 TaxID=3155523 RepID=UPI0034388DA1
MGTPTPEQLYAYLSYDDATSALDWLQAVGFQVVTRQDGAGGTVTHAEVRMGNVVLMIASADAAYTVPTLRGQSTGSGIYLWMPASADVDSWHERALSAGGSSVISPEDTDWGSRRARVLDPEGHEWSAGTYRPGSTW